MEPPPWIYIVVPMSCHVMSFVRDLTAALSHPDMLHAFGVLIGTKISEALSDYEDRIRNCEAKLSVKDKKIEEIESQLQECNQCTGQHENLLDVQSSMHNIPVCVLCAFNIQNGQKTRMRTEQH